MADNLSSLISDAFTIYSEAYYKIGRIGLKVTELKGSPLQPKLWKELVYATRLYRVIEPSIVLNGGGTAIVGVVGDIATINNLLLKLKRAVKLYTENVFPTPLTEIVFVVGEGGGANEDATYLTVNTEGTLPQSRRVVQGSGIAITDNGAQGTFVVSNTAAPSVLEFDASINPVLNMGGMIERLFRGSVAISGTRTWSLSDSSNALRLQASFSITGLTPGNTTHNQTLWAGCTIFTNSGIAVGNVFQPMDNGTYELIATTYDGVNWKVRIY